LVNAIAHPIGSLRPDGFIAVCVHVFLSFRQWRALLQPGPLLFE
jgi:hypothetical protein